MLFTVYQIRKLRQFSTSFTPNIYAHHVIIRTIKKFIGSETRSPYPHDFDVSEGTCKENI
jgi:hypothetical protein